MHGASAKREVLVTASSSPSSRAPGPAAQSNDARPTPRRQKPKHVIYKSTALQRTAPSLVAAAAAPLISSSEAIQRAADDAERIRDEFKLAKCGPEIADVADGDDEATNAKKYERRLLMNRHSAAASRVRREAYTKALEAQVVGLEGKMISALKALEAEKEKNRRLVASASTEDLADDMHPDHPSEAASDEEEEMEEDVGSDVEHGRAHAVEQHPLEPDGFMGMSMSAAFLPMRNLESQTEDNLTPLPVADAAPPMVPPEAPPQQQPAPLMDVGAPVKSEDFMLASTIPDDMLLDCFLCEDAMPSQVEFDSLELL